MKHRQSIIITYYLYNNTHLHPLTMLGRDDCKNSNKSGEIKVDFSVRQDRNSPESCGVDASLTPWWPLQFLWDTWSIFSLEMSSTLSVSVSVLLSTLISNGLSFNEKLFIFHLLGRDRSFWGLFGPGLLEHLIGRRDRKNDETDPPYACQIFTAVKIHFINVECKYHKEI